MSFFLFFSFLVNRGFLSYSISSGSIFKRTKGKVYYKVLFSFHLQSLLQTSCITTILIVLSMDFLQVILKRSCLPNPAPENRFVEPDTGAQYLHVFTYFMKDSHRTHTVYTQHSRKIMNSWLPSLNVRHHELECRKT